MRFIILLFFICQLLFSCNKSKVINSYYANGKLKESYTLINDTVSGVLINYYDDGNIKSTTPYLNNLPNGFYKEYYNNGNLKISYFLKNSHKEGIKYLYDINGNILEKSKFISGNRNGIYKEYNSSGKLKTLALFYNNKQIFLVDDELKNDNFNANNYLDIASRDTIETDFFEAKIIVKNCTYDKLTFYEGSIDTIRYFDIKDTLNIFEQISDSIVVYKTNKIKKGINYWSGILYAKRVTQDTILYYPYPILEQFYKK